MARKTNKKTDPNWGNKLEKHILQLQICFEAFGSLLTSIQKMLFSLKKLWFSIAGLSSFTYIPEALNWITLSNSML
jgi:hypothetical protein